jgi:hypothetical protein
MTKPRDTPQSTEMLTSGHLREPLKALLSARPDGLGEAMLAQLIRMGDRPAPLARQAAAFAVDPDDRWMRVMRRTCRALGAKRDEFGVWSMPAKQRAA